MVVIEDYPFIFMNTPASLQYLASAEMALMLWRCKYASTSHLYETPRSFCEARRFGCKEVLGVPIPRRIEALINDHILRIGFDLYSWMEFHSEDRKFLDGSCAEEFCRYFNHLVVDFTGSIGFKASAKNILNSGEFSDDVLNYKIACTFCLEDQVKRFWPSVENDARIKNIVKFDHDTCYVSYWNGCMKSGNSINDAELAKILILHTVGSYGYNGTAFDYFYKMLADHERESIFDFLITKAVIVCPALIFSSSSFHKLDRFQAERLLKSAHYGIFSLLGLSDNEYYFQFALQLWTRMRHLVLEDASISVKVVAALWETVEPEWEFSNRRIYDLMVEIWSDASDELKGHISDGYLTHGYDCEFSEVNEHNVTFVSALLQSSRKVSKEKAWEKVWLQVALRSKALYFEQLMKYCLTDDDAVELFKDRVADSKYLFESLIRAGSYADLKDYLMFCSKDTERQFQQLGIKVLASNLYFILLHDDDKFAKFEWFVGELFSNVREDVDKFKVQIISSVQCVQFVLTVRQADEISSNDFRRIISRFVSDERELQLVKRELFECCRTCSLDFIYKMEKFDANQWPNFLEWCTSDHEEISTFKRSLNVDVIFIAHLRNYLLRRYGEILDLPDNFLNWYFENAEDEKNFKLEKITNYEQIDVLRIRMRWEICVDDSEYRLLVWFFESNVENLREFCKTCNLFIRTRRSPAPSWEWDTEFDIDLRSDFEKNRLAREFNSILEKFVS